MLEILFYKKKKKTCKSFSNNKCFDINICFHLKYFLQLILHNASRILGKKITRKMNSKKEIMREKLMRQNFQIL